MQGGKPEKMNGKRKTGAAALAVLFWLAVWQVASVAVGREILLPSPFAVLQALARLAQTGAFWLSAWGSLWRIALGYAAGFALGVLLAVASAAWPAVRGLLAPPMHLVRATPVASFIILALVWMNSHMLSVFISFLMVLPVLYSAALAGIAAADGELLEMAQVFRVGRWRRLCAIYVPAAAPSVLPGAQLALGLAWKSGVAAEVIGLVANTVGGEMYTAKIYLEMPEMFAWTATVIVLSWAFGKAAGALLRLCAGGLARAWLAGGMRKASGALPGDAATEQTGAVYPCEASPVPLAFALEDVSKGFDGKLVLSGFSAQFAPGSRTAVTGASGAGKTTLLRLLAGLAQPDAGTVRRDAAGARVAVLFQEDRLCPALSAAENVMLVLPRAMWGRVRPALAALGLAGETAGQAAQTLSGGEKRRAALARAVLAQSGALLLDEPFKGFDAGTRAAAVRFVRENLGGRTLVVVTHAQQDAVDFGASGLQL